MDTPSLKTKTKFRINKTMHHPKCQLSVGAEEEEEEEDGGGKGGEGEKFMQRSTWGAIPDEMRIKNGQHQNSVTRRFNQSADEIHTTAFLCLREITSSLVN